MSTTACDGDVNPRWLKVCKKNSKKKTTLDAQLERSAQCRQRKRSRSQLIQVHQNQPCPRTCSRTCQRAERPENNFYQVFNKDTGIRRQQDHVQVEQGVHAVNNFRHAQVTNAVASATGRIWSCLTKKAASSRTQHRDGRCRCVRRTEST